ncbi:MAG: GAF domain-containing protein [Dehalococcoidia bacterium]
MTEIINQKSPDSDSYERLAEEQRRLAEIGRIVSSSLDIAEVYPTFAAQARALVAADRLVITVFSEDKTELIDLFIDGTPVEDSYPGARHPVAKDELYTQIFVEKVPFVASGQSFGEYKPGNNFEDARREAGFSSLLLVPLIWQRSSYGVLSFRAFNPDAFGDHEIELAVQISSPIAGAIATVTQYELLQRDTLAREQLGEIRRIVGSSLNIAEIFEAFAEQTRLLVPADRLVLTTVDGAGDVIGRHTDGLEIQEVGTPALSIVIRDEIFQHIGAKQSFFVKKGREYVQYAREMPEESPRYAAGLRAMLSIPLIWQGDLVGSLTFRSTNPDAYGDRDIEIAEQISIQAASAVHAANQFTILEREFEERAQLADIGRIVRSTLNLDDVFSAFAEQAKELVPFDRLIISTVDVKSGLLTDQHVTGMQSATDNMTGPLTIEESVLPKQVYEDHQVVVADSTSLRKIAITDDADDNRHRLAAGLNSLMTVPILLQGHFLGALSFRSKDDDPYHAREMRLGEQIASLVAGVIASDQQVTLLEVESAGRQRLAEEQARIAAIGRIVISTVDIQEVFTRFVEQARVLIPFDRIVISTLSDDGSTVTDELVDGVDAETATEGAVHPTDKNPLQRDALFGGEEIVLNGDEYQATAETIPTEKIRFDSGLKSVLMAPMRWQGRVIGVVNFRSKLSDAYGDHQVDLAKQISAQIAGAVATSRQYSLLQEESTERRRLAEEHSRIAAIGRIVSSTLKIDEVFSLFAEEACVLVPFDRLVISLNEPGGTTTADVFVSGQATENDRIGELFPIAGGMKEGVIRENRTVVANESEFRQLAQKFPSESIKLNAGLLSLLVAPLTWQGSVFGTLIFRSRLSNPYHAHQVDLANQISAQIAGAIATSYQFGQLEREGAEKEIRGSIGLKASQSLSLNDLFEGLADDIAEIIPYARLAFFENDWVNSQRTVIFARGVTEELWQVGMPNPFKSDWNVKALSDDEISDYWLGSFRLHTIDHQSEKGSMVGWMGPNESDPDDDGRYSSWLEIPVGIPNEIPTGFLLLRARGADVYSEADLDLISQIGLQITPAISNAKTHAQLEESEANYRDLVESSNILVWRMDSKGRFEYVNKALQKVLEYSYNELIGTRFSDFMAPDFRDTALERFESRAEINESHSGEAAYFTKSGKQLHLAYSWLRTFDADGGFVGVRGTALDVTAERKAQDDLKIQTTALDNASDVVIVFLPDNTIAYVNNTFVREMGYSKKEIIGRDSSILRPDSSVDDAYNKILEHVHQGNIWRGTILSRRKNGEIFTVDASLSPVYAEDGSITSVVAVRRDFTEQIQAELEREARSELDAQNQHLQELNEQLDEFFSTVSH